MKDMLLNKMMMIMIMMMMMMMMAFLISPIVLGKPFKR
jgi:hypothetical protein